MKRVVLLGASNLTLGFPTVVQTVRRVVNEPVDILAAMGLGRSFGARSNVLGRVLPGIEQCGLWEILKKSPSGSTHALITDIGNDIAYEVPVPEIINWLTICLDRLGDVNAQIIVTKLPLQNLQKMMRWQFFFFRSVFFPGRKLSQSEIINRVSEVQYHLESLSKERGFSLIEPKSSWYGADPIHIKRRSRRQAWEYILSEWSSVEAGGAHIDYSLRQRMSFRFMAPEKRWVLGIERRKEQPCGGVGDGTVIGLY